MISQNNQIIKSNQSFLTLTTFVNEILLADVSNNFKKFKIHRHSPENQHCTSVVYSLGPLFPNFFASWDPWTI